MQTTLGLFARLVGLYEELQGYRSLPDSRTALPVTDLMGYIKRYGVMSDELRRTLPGLYADLPVRRYPKSLSTTGKDRATMQLLRDLEYVFGVRANSGLWVEKGTTAVRASGEQRVFISHGRSGDWREVQSYIERDLKISTLELAQEASRGRTILQKLHEESERCAFAVVVMTGDDEVTDGPPRARENVLHEIGYFQGKYGLSMVCLLHEEGANIPSNIHGLVYVPFPKGLVNAAFGVLGREIHAAFGDATGV